ncbi:MAG: hypothetical protein LBP86_08330 [Azoarcus sp.]|nr:hypothetical protein [Azoarcus sp.]
MRSVTYRTPVPCETSSSVRDFHAQKSRGWLSTAPRTRSISAFPKASEAASIAVPHHQGVLVAEFAPPRAATVGDLDGIALGAAVVAPPHRALAADEVARARPVRGRRASIHGRRLPGAVSRTPSTRSSGPNRPPVSTRLAPEAGCAAGFAGRQPLETHEARRARPVRHALHGGPWSVHS